MSAFTKYFFYTDPFHLDISYASFVAASRHPGVCPVFNLAFLGDDLPDEFPQGFQRLPTDIRCGLRVSFDIDLNLLSKLIAHCRPQVVIASAALSGLEVSQAESFIEMVKNSPGQPQLLVEVTSVDEFKTLEEKSQINGYICSGCESLWAADGPSTLLLIQQIINVSPQAKLYPKGGIGYFSGAAFLALGAAGLAFEFEMAGFWERFAASGGVDPKATHPYSKDILIKYRQQWSRALFENVEATIGQEEECTFPREIILADTFADFADCDLIANEIGYMATSMRESSEWQYPFCEDAPLSQVLGSNYPIIQGPMAWISEKVDFARQVYDSGALPVFATGTMNPDKIESLLKEAKDKGLKSFGVGLMGFEKQEKMREQVDLFLKYGPAIVVVAGGTPEQAEHLRGLGLKAFIHIPSAEVLDIFLRRGHNRFILEGRESGGHVGEQTSLLLWETALEQMLMYYSDGPKDDGLSLVLAGGLYTPYSAAFAALLTRVAQEQGISIGLQLGTAYLATSQAKSCGIVTPLYQELLQESKCSAVIGTPLKHRIHVLKTPVAKKWQELELAYYTADQPLDKLQEQAANRLGDRFSMAIRGSVAGQELARDEQLQDGLFMSGTVASLIDQTLSVDDITANLTKKAKDLLAEPAEVVAYSSDSSLPGMLLFSGRSSVELEQAIQSARIILDNLPAEHATTAMTLWSLKHHQQQPYAAGFLFENVEEAQKKIDSLLDQIGDLDKKPLISIDQTYLTSRSGALKSAFLYPGQGTLYADMGKNLASRIDDLKERLEEIAGKYTSFFDNDLFQIFEQTKSIPEPWMVQPLMCGLEMVLGSTLAKFGLRSDFHCGHSLGELAALAGAGATNQDETLKLAHWRGLYMEQHGKEGTLLVVFLPHPEVQRIIDLLPLSHTLRVANINTPKQTVVSGSSPDIELLEKLLKSYKIRFVNLNLPYPFHSPLLNGASKALLEYLSQEPLNWQVEELEKVIANVTGASYLSSIPARASDENQAKIANETVAFQVVSPVQFSKCVRNLHAKGVGVFFEVGPGKVLSNMLRDILPADDNDWVAAPVLVKGQETRSFLDACLLALVTGTCSDDARLQRQLADLYPIAKLEQIRAEWEWSIESSLEKSAQEHMQAGEYFDDDIAVVAYSVQAPDAPDAEKYWENIFKSTVCTKDVPRSKWDSSVHYDKNENASNKTYGNSGGFSDFDLSDAPQFGVSPKAAEEIDRMQVVGLQLTRDLFGSIGYDNKNWPHRDTAIIVAYAFSEYASGSHAITLYLEHLKLEIEKRLKNISEGREVLKSFLDDLISSEVAKVPEFTSISAVAALSNMVSARISRYIDANCTNFVVDSACSSSLSAINTALLYLKNGDCRYVITGGLDDFSIGRQIGFSKSFALSKKGACTPFDEEADGLLQGDGGGLVLLTTLRQAEADGMPVLGIIRGMGGSSDGSKSSSLITPSQERQTLSGVRCFKDAQLKASDIDYVEAHGTGTALGDVTEIGSLSELFKGLPPRSLPIGSVKANIGHTMVVAGTMSMIKVLETMKNGIIPPIANLKRLNPKLDNHEHPFQFPKEARAWMRRRPHVPRRALICSYGFGGTNQHLAVEEYLPADDRQKRLPRLFLYHGRNRKDLQNILKRASFNEKSNYSSFTCPKTGIRVSLVATSQEEFAARIEIVQRELESNNTKFGQILGDGIMISRMSLAPDNMKIGVVFPGHGCQYDKMGVDLYRNLPAFEEIMDIKMRACLLFSDDLYSNYEQRKSFITPVQQDRRMNVLTTSTLIAAVNLAYFRMIELLGVKPDVCAGYSLGEYTALVAGGVLDYDNYLKMEDLSLKGYRDYDGQTVGHMTSVIMRSKELSELITRVGPDVNVAMSVADDFHIVSGLSASMGKLEAQLRERKVVFKRTEVQFPYHWNGLVSLYEKLVDVFSTDVRVSHPKLPIVPAIPGSDYEKGPEYSIRSIAGISLKPLDLQDQIRKLADRGVSVFIEAGANATYSRMIAQVLRDQPHWCLPMDGPPGNMSSTERFFHFIGSLYCMGIEVHYQGLEQIFGWYPQNVRNFESRRGNLLRSDIPQDQDRAGPVQTDDSEAETASSEQTDDADVSYKAVPVSVRSTVNEIIKKHTGFDDSFLKDTANLQEELGIDSIQQMLILNEINENMEVDLMSHISWDDPPKRLGDLLMLLCKAKGLKLEE
jgi:acyl transferase domain-containing protein